MQHAPAPVHACHVLVHVQVEEDAKMSFIKNLGKKQSPFGRYSYRGQDNYAGMSLQLRVEADHKGVMVINGNNILHLNQTATAYAYYFMQGLPEAEVVAKIRGMYRVKPETSKSRLRKTRLHHKHIGADPENRPHHLS